MEEARTPENGNLLKIDPVVLMQHNPAILIVNHEQYDRIHANFDKNRFHPVDAAWVTTYSSEDHRPVDELFVIDGMTRTKYAYDRKGEDPFFDAIDVQDVTLSELRSPLTVFPNEVRKGQTALTMEQYLRAVVPPTVEHSAIVDDRIAAHLIRAWEAMVGGEVASQFSALAALSLLANDQLPIATDAQLRRVLVERPALLGKIASDDRDRVKDALCTMASTIRQAKRTRREVAHAAYFLVASTSPVIGGQKEAQKQIYGLLHNPALEAKIAKVAAPGLPTEQERIELARVLSSAFARFPDNRLAMEDFIRACENPSLTLVQTIDVLSSPDPVRSYGELIKEINYSKLQREYLSRVKKEEPSRTERIIIENLGRQTNLPTFLNSFVDGISIAERALETANQWKERFTREAGSLQKRGVRPQTIEQAMFKISEQEEKVLTTRTATALTQQVNELQRVLSKADEEIAKEVLEFQVGESIDEIYGKELAAGHGPLVRDRIVWHIIHSEDINPANEWEVKRRLRDLKHLDEDLQTQVINGLMRMSTATSRQAERQRAKTRERMPMPPAVFEGVFPVEKAPEAVSEVSSPAQPTVLRRQEIDITKTVESVAKRRVEINNQRVNEALNLYGDPLARELRNIDLEPFELTRVNKERIGALETLLEKLRTGRLNAVYALDVTLPQREKQLEEIHKARVAQEMEETSRDTRTGR